MGLDLGKTHGWIASEVAHSRPPGESMSRLIDLCEAAHPHEDWSRFRSLPYADLSALMAWLQRPFGEEPPARPLRGLWFGLFNPCPDGRTPVADIYICGSERFEPDPDDNNWAVGPDWSPVARCGASATLADIYRIAHRQAARKAERTGCLGNDAEYPLCLGFGVFAVREILARIEPSLILGESDSLGVAVGFDSGDFVLLGELTSHGLRPIAAEAGPREVSVTHVLEDLRSSDRRKVFLAVSGLKRLGDRAQEAVAELLRIASTSPEFGLRQCAIGMLGVIAHDDPRAKAAISQALNDSSPFVRREALQAFISIKQLSSLDLARIKDMENDPDEDVARWSEIAIRNIRLRSETGAEPEAAPERGGV